MGMEGLAAAAAVPPVSPGRERRGGESVCPGGFVRFDALCLISIQMLENGTVCYLEYLVKSYLVFS